MPHHRNHAKRNIDLRKARKTCAKEQLGTDNKLREFLGDGKDITDIVRQLRKIVLGLIRKGDLRKAFPICEDEASI